MIAIILTCTNVFSHQKRLSPIERQTSDSEPFLHIVKDRFYLQYHAIRAPALTAEGCSYFCARFCERSNQRKPAVQQRAGRMSAGFTWSGSDAIVQRIQPVQTSNSVSKSTRKMRRVNMVTTSFVLMVIVSHIFSRWRQQKALSGFVRRCTSALTNKKRPPSLWKVVVEVIYWRAKSMSLPTKSNTQARAATPMSGCQSQYTPKRVWHQST